MATFYLCRKDGFIDCVLETDDLTTVMNQEVITKERGFYVEANSDDPDIEDFYVNPATKSLERKRDYSLDKLPLPCTITIEGIDYHCNEQPEFQFDAPGVYLIEVDAGGPYKNKEFEYEHVDQS